MVPATAKDSLIKQVQQRDSNIMSYVKAFNSIQKGIDSLMIDERVLKLSGEKHTITDTATIAQELRTIGKLIIKNRRALTYVQSQLRKSNEKNQDLSDLGENLSKQLNEKDSEIATIQRELVRTKASLATVVKQYNDSLGVIAQQRQQIGLMKIQGNTVYYIIGKESDLKSKNIITERGGVVGLGRVPLLGQSTAGFTSGDLTELHEISLGGTFVQFVTTHPNNSYRVTSDKIIINDPQDFWSRSKYMVVIIR